jgi:Ca2+-binding EF-hand superfamily protein
MGDAAAVREAKAKVRMESTRRMFDSVDSDKSGSIDPIEFQRLMRKLDATMSAQDVKAALGILDANGDGVISFTEFAAWWCAGDPKENLARLREAISSGASAGENEPFTFTLDAAQASMAAEAQSDPKALETMAALKQDLDASVQAMAKPSAPAAKPATLSPEEQRKKDEKMKRRHQLDIIFAQFDKDGSGDIDIHELTALSKELGQEWSAAQTDEVMKEMDGDGSGTVDAKELRDWLEDYEAGGGGLLGVALRNELDKALEISAALEDEIADFLSSSSDDDGGGEGEAAEDGEQDVGGDDELFGNKPMRVSRRVVPGEDPQ